MRKGDQTWRIAPVPTKVVDTTAAGDSFEFIGYGPGATFTVVNATHWQINYNAGASHEVITIANGAAIDASTGLLKIRTEPVALASEANAIDASAWLPLIWR
mgnify:CR=1 FL=1